MIKQVEIDDEKQVVLSRETFEQFRKMGTVFMDLKAKGIQIEQATEAISKLEDLVARYKVSYELIVYCVLRMTSVFGLNTPDGKMVRPAVLSGEENPMRGVLKELGSLMTNAMLAESNPKGDAANKMKERFAFFNYLPYLFTFYENQKQFKVNIPPSFLTDLPEAVKTELQ